MYEKEEREGRNGIILCSQKEGTIKVQQNIYILCWGIFKHIPHLTVSWVI